MLKINSLNDTQTLNYRAHVLESHMYTGKLKFEFLTFIDQDYINHCNKQAKIGFKQNKERDMAIAALILGTGIRVSECAGVDLSDLNLKDAVLDVTRKGGQKDSVPIAEWTLPYIKRYKGIRNERYHADSKQVAFFLTQWHGQTRRITTNAIEKMINKYSAAFGHPLTPHKLRHTVASELYEVTKDQVLVAQQLGQKVLQPPIYILMLIRKNSVRLSMRSQKKITINQIKCKNEFGYSIPNSFFINVSISCKLFWSHDLDHD